MFSIKWATTADIHFSIFTAEASEALENQESVSRAKVAVELIAYC